MAKSVTSLVFGRAMQLGLVSPDDPVGSLVPEADGPHGAITLRDLLTMTSGLRWNGFRDYNIFTMPDRIVDALTLEPVPLPVLVRDVGRVLVPVPSARIVVEVARGMRRIDRVSDPFDREHLVHERAVRAVDREALAVVGPVVLLLHHEDEGSFGFIINRPTGIKIHEILKGMEVGWQGSDEVVAHFGGPVQPQLGTVLFSASLTNGDEIRFDHFIGKAKPIGIGVEPVEHNHYL